MVQNFRPNRKDDEIRVKMDITVDLPAEVAEQAERMGICEFDQCTFDEATRRMTASVTTVFYRKGRDHLKRIRVISLAVIAALSLTVTSFAAEKSPQQSAAAYLSEAGIMLGNESGDMMLEQGLTRAQMAALLTRIVTDPEQFETDSAFYRSLCSFTDVPEWAKSYVGYCAANNLVAGYGNGRYGSNDPVTSAAACTVMLRCLNDVDAVWDYQSACRTAVQLGLAAEETVADAEITRGNMAVLICRTMARLGYDVKLSETVQSNLSANGTSDAAAAQETAEPFDAAAAKQDIIDRTNALRCENGVAALTVNEKLMQAAQVRAEEMAASGVYSHTRPDGRKYTTVTDCKYIGENIHLIGEWQIRDSSLPSFAVEAWKNSAAHLKICSATRYHEIGVGVSQRHCHGRAHWYCVQLFLLDGYNVTWVDAPAAKG